MTTSAPDPLSLVLTSPRPGTARLTIDGDLDYNTADELMAAALAALDGAELSDLYLDCGGMGFCDSSGLATLLRIHQRAGAAGTRLHLEKRPLVLERLLDISGTYEYLTGAPATDT
ncbi:STAS domain-containing protein [Nonomuraea sp. NPDC050310]|uniref:STAS domain-containing protein n=1 Tax=Nonomuraea sp. NPDC050310 TaxID=3154935 RepID=UPI00340ABE18